MKARNMQNSSGKEVANQFIITGEGEDSYKSSIEIFQSYGSVIAKRYYQGGRLHIQLDINKWDYSKTTGRYRNQFLGESKKETEAKIKDGTYELVDLNS